nr:unnamed protein product [Callosobruchus chinensis]
MFLRTLYNQTTKPAVRKFVRNKSQSSAEYCMESVKQYDYENFACTILLPNSCRACGFAVRSFNVEIARIAEQVSQETIALMRLKFWEEAIEKCLHNNSKLVPKHPVAIEIFKANSTNKLSKRYFLKLISSRQEYFKRNTFNNLEDLEKYAEGTVSSIYYLILEGSGVKNINADHAASHLGKAQGIAQQIRSASHAGRLNFIPIPLEILAKNKVSQEDLLRSKSSESLRESVFEVASKSHQHLEKARNLLQSVPKEARKFLLPAIPVRIYLDRLQKVNYDIFHPSLRHRSWKLLPQLWLYNVRNKY